MYSVFCDNGRTGGPPDGTITPRRWKFHQVVLLENERAVLHRRVTPITLLITQRNPIATKWVIDYLTLYTLITLQGPIDFLKCIYMQHLSLL